MALSLCYECGQQVGKGAEKCPNCGAPQRRIAGFLMALFVIAVGAYIVMWVLGSSEAPESRPVQYGGPQLPTSSVGEFSR